MVTAAEAAAAAAAAVLTVETHDVRKKSSAGARSPQVEGGEVLPQAELGHSFDFVPAEIERDEMS